MTKHVIALENCIIANDNLISLQQLPDSCVDLIYMDPPFNPNVSYTCPVSNSQAQEFASEEAWRWGKKAEARMEHVLKCTPPGAEGLAKVMALICYDLVPKSYRAAYVAMMGLPLWECRRALKPTGTIWVHCDPNESSTLRLLLDSIFGAKNFRSQITWVRHSAHNSSKWAAGSISDILLVYTKSADYTWNKVCHVLTKTIENMADGCDDYGYYTLEDITGPEPSASKSGVTWRGTTPAKLGKREGRHWQLPENLIQNYFRFVGESIEGQELTQQLDRLYEKGFIYIPEKKGAWPKYKRYLNDYEGIVLQNVWADIPAVHPRSSEFEEFKGQKPLALLERIIKVSSKEGDLVLDPFLGSGTTAIAAQTLKRKWLGFELTSATAAIAVDRLNKTFGENENSWLRISEPMDIEAAKELAASDSYAFQCVIVRKLGGAPRGQGADRGIDGDFTFNGFADGYARSGGQQVKGGKTYDTTTSTKWLKIFKDDLVKEQKLLGVFCLFKEYLGIHGPDNIESFARDAGTFTSGHKGDNRVFQKLQIVYIEDMYKCDKSLSDLVKVPGNIIEEDERITKTRKMVLKTNERESIFDIMAMMPQEGGEEER